MIDFIPEIAIGLSLACGAIYWLPPYRLNTIVLGGILLCLSGILAHFYWIYSLYIFQQPHGFMMYVPLLLFLGPLLYTYFRCRTQESIPSKTFFIKHFFVPVLITLCLLPIYFLSVAEKLTLLNLMYSGTIPTPYLILSWFCGAVLLGYCVAMIWHQKTLFTAKLNQQPGLVKGFLMVNIGFISVLMISMLSVVHALAIVRIGTLIFSGLFILIFVTATRYSDFFDSWLEVVQDSYRKRSYLEGKDRVSLVHDLKQLMEDQQWYLNSELKHADVANALGLNKYQLSQLLSEELGQKFSGFIRDYRVDAAKKLLIEKDWLTTTAIAFEVGYNSFSSFHAHFKQVTGQSPGQYRTELGKSSEQ